MSVPQSALFEPLHLPNGRVIPNRIAKAAMEENMAASGQLPGGALYTLYEAWANGGSGLIITGNVMIDGRAMTGPGGIVLEAGMPLQPFQTWAQRARRGGAQVWMQLNHPGRQTPVALGGNAWSASDVALDLGKHSKYFPRPKAMSEAEIAEVIARFAISARLAEEAGFTGVEIHAAHGYLLSQFLSPLTNHRTDRWGGSLENRARLLLETVIAVRAVVSSSFCVAVKLNSADFQRGGFDANDAKCVVTLLNELPIDLIEISGGSYESPAMQGRASDGRTLAREAYFLEFAHEIAAIARMPVMTTGGIRRRIVAEHVLASGVAVVGLATALAMMPSLPAAWSAGQDIAAPYPDVRWKDKTLAAMASMAVMHRQLQCLGKGKQPASPASPLLSLILDQLRTKVLAKRYRKWLTSQRISAPPFSSATAPVAS